VDEVVGSPYHSAARILEAGEGAYARADVKSADLPIAA
jgi:hypothetical protein